MKRRGTCHAPPSPPRALCLPLSYLIVVSSYISFDVGCSSLIVFYQVHEMIIISLFDEVEIDDRGSGGYLDDETSIRREKRFLGSVFLPFQVRINVHT